MIEFLRSYLAKFVSELLKISNNGAAWITKLVMRQYYKWWYDPRHPHAKTSREAKIIYDFHATGDAEQAIQKITNQALDYLKDLDRSIKKLETIQEYLITIKKYLKKIANAIIDHDKPKILSRLEMLKNSFNLLYAALNEFLSSIEFIPREVIYAASELMGIKIIKKYNNQLNMFKNQFNILEKKELTDLLAQSLNIILTSLPETSNSSKFSIEELQQEIKNYMSNPEEISVRINLILQGNKKLADNYIKLIQTFASFNGKIEQIDSLKKNPNWLPLLIETEQLGAHIFLDLMRKIDILVVGKELIQIYLRKPNPKYLMIPIKTNILAHQIVSYIRSWQIYKCKQLIGFLEQLKHGSTFPEPDPDGLLDYLKCHNTAQDPNEFLKKILVFCFVFDSKQSIITKLQYLMPNINALLEEHKESHWGAIREKIDKLNQLPKSFKAKIISNLHQQDSESDSSNIISGDMQNKAKTLIANIDHLRSELVESKLRDSKLLSGFRDEYEKNYKKQRIKENKAGIARLRQAQPIILSLPSSNILSSYLSEAGKFDKVNNSQQVNYLKVPTIYDLSQLIYKGVPPEILHQLQATNLINPSSNQLTDSFFPDPRNDSKLKIWLYALNEGYFDKKDVLAYLFPLTEYAFYPVNKYTLASQADIKINLPIILVLLKSSNKVPFIPTKSKALYGVSTLTAKKINTIIKQLLNYWLLAFVRMNPQYRNQLPLWKKLKFYFKNLPKFSFEIGLERVQTVERVIRELCAALLAEDEAAVINALTKFQKKYSNWRQIAKNVSGSELYTLLDNAIAGPIGEILHHLETTSENNLDSNLVEQQASEVMWNESEKKVETIASGNDDFTRAVESGPKAKEKAQAELEDLKASSTKEGHSKPQVTVTYLHSSIYHFPDTSQIPAANCSNPDMTAQCSTFRK